MSPRDWERSERALELLTELDAVERESDFCSGQGWRDAALAHGERARDIEGDLDTLRCESVNAFADATGHSRDTDAWLDAWVEADDEAETVERAAQSARRNRLGDKILLGQAA